MQCILLDSFQTWKYSNIPKDIINLIPKKMRIKRTTKENFTFTTYEKVQKSLVWEKIGMKKQKRIVIRWANEVERVRPKLYTIVIIKEKKTWPTRLVWISTELCDAKVFFFRASLNNTGQQTTEIDMKTKSTECAYGFLVVNRQAGKAKKKMNWKFE